MPKLKKLKKVANFAEVEEVKKVPNFAEVEEVKKVPNFAEVEEVKKVANFAQRISYKANNCQILFHFYLVFYKEIYLLIKEQSK